MNETVESIKVMAYNEATQAWEQKSKSQDSQAGMAYSEDVLSGLAKSGTWARIVKVLQRDSVFKEVNAPKPTTPAGGGNCGWG